MSVGAVLLVGPTGSGKTPLGDALERRGLWGCGCRHFDFGSQLRRVAAGGGADVGLADADVDVVRKALCTGALLEDHQFHIARRILESFLLSFRTDDRTLVVLNGLPRHPGQARAVEGLVAVEAVVSLACSPEVAAERIRTNAGRDRAERTDDDLAAVAARLTTFEARTAPLLDHYRRRGVRVLTIEVAPASAAEDLCEDLNRCPPE